MRRFVSSILVPLVLLSQALCFAHACEYGAAHGPSAPAPHFHTRPATPPAGLLQSEESPLHGHDDDSGDELPQSGEHDEDAVYVSSADAPPGRTAPAVAPFPAAEPNLALSAPPPRVPAARPRSDRWRSRPIYLLTLNLRN